MTGKQVGTINGTPVIAYPTTNEAVAAQAAAAHRHIAAARVVSAGIWHEGRYGAIPADLADDIAQGRTNKPTGEPYTVTADREDA